MTFDVLIIGGGLVGASLAAALKSSGLNMALVETQPTAFSNEGWDNRMYAISPGGAAFLTQCDAWQQLDMNRVQPVETMRVFGDEDMELDFSAYQLGVPELAFILENRLLQQVLWQGLQEQDNLTLFHPAHCASLVWHDDAAYLQLKDGRTLKAKLVIGADGGNSWVRQQAGIVAPPTLYNQHGVVANFTVEKSHRATAFQWFQPDGILALLPLPQHMVSMVWSVSPEKSEVLLQLSHEELCAQVAAASHHTLGALQLVTPPAAFPLRFLNLPQIIKPRLALVGDAAHNIHPLAGQGVNLGFRDARQLAQVLLQRDAQQDCGNIHLLRRYERARKEDVLSMLLTTDVLKKLFNNSNPLLRAVRNVGLAATNRIAPLKKMLARHALN
ncbi:UbiH/UbiF family hydroxylase [Candidatus Nitrotoga arctica]|uniref:2-octaprenyl-3-methyl-6-methoxy-1,4-benzoquinol hydroxylase n=1 Tax=Candidatus Nitrotoga arctica TaxID=453162 RepID=A0ABM8Z2Y6_9PROT|nr:UbiH/UbiF family hydroxylase [Candidatus Nitrotoga arctica]CAG9934266.1 2-octaprenyl-3-methyl-6-methoxy-1,4-benzoquinol hydroxylase [Candidatus Nitrotoga arctica]